MSKNHNPMDSAALAAGAIAAVLAVTGPKGPYDIISAVTGFVIVMVLIAYELPVPRSNKQNIAFGTILSLSTIPIAGYFIELILTGMRHQLDFESFFNGVNLEKYTEADSAVPKSYTFFLWVLFSIIYWFVANRASEKAQKA